MLSLAIITLAVYAETWLDHNWKHEVKLALNLKIDYGGEPFFGYTWTIGLLTVAALLAVWIPR